MTIATTADTAICYTDEQVIEVFDLELHNEAGGHLLFCFNEQHAANRFNQLEYDDGTSLRVGGYFSCPYGGRCARCVLMPALVDEEPPATVEDFDAFMQGDYDPEIPF